MKKPTISDFRNYFDPPLKLAELKELKESDPEGYEELRKLHADSLTESESD